MTLRFTQEEYDQMQARRKFIICADCGVTDKRNGPGQIYCEACSGRRQVERMEKWSRDHGREKSLKPQSAIKSLQTQKGIAASAEVASTIAWEPYQPPDLLWLARVTVPFSYGYSKNAIYSYAGAGHVSLRKKTKVLRSLLLESLKEAIANATCGLGCVEAKVWLDILVQKSNHRGDAVNVVDTVCDAAKVACGIDDRWFSIRRLDWEIVKQDGSLIVGIGQETTEHHRPCSCCGIVKILEGNFCKKTRARLGYDRTCKDCRSTKPRLVA